MSNSVPPLGPLNYLGGRSPRGPPLGLNIETSNQTRLSSASSDLKRTCKTGENTNNSKYRPGKTKEEDDNILDMDNTFDDGSVPVLNPKVDHKDEIVLYLTDVAYAVIANGNTTIGFGLLKITPACLSNASRGLKPKQDELETLGNARDFLQGM